MQNVKDVIRLFFYFTSLYGIIFISPSYASYTAKKMKLPIKDFFRKFFRKFPAGLVTFTEEILNGKLMVVNSYPKKAFS